MASPTSPSITASPMQLLMDTSNAAPEGDVSPPPQTSLLFLTARPSEQAPEGPHLPAIEGTATPPKRPPPSTTSTAIEMTLKQGRGMEGATNSQMLLDQSPLQPLILFQPTPNTALRSLLQEIESWGEDTPPLPTPPSVHPKLFQPQMQIHPSLSQLPTQIPSNLPQPPLQFHEIQPQFQISPNPSPPYNYEYSENFAGNPRN